MSTHFSGPVYTQGKLLGAGDDIPAGGTHFYVKPASGLDGNDGLSPEYALKTLAAAYAKCTANKNDVVHLIAESNTASATTDYLSAALTWAKDLTHLIGECAPSLVSQRARIAQLSTATGVDGLLTVSANGCIFRNFSLFQGVDDNTSNVCLKVTGTRNVFQNVHIGGIGHATMIGGTSTDLLIDAGQENLFESCVIGLDTIARDASCSNITLNNSATRNYFRNCLVQAYLSVAGYHVEVGANGVDRWCIFENCSFISDSENRGVAQTAVIHAGNQVQGQILLFGCRTASVSGTPDWVAAGTDGVLVQGDMVAPAAACAGGLMTKGAAS